MEPNQHDATARPRASARAGGRGQQRTRNQVSAIARAAGRTCSRSGCGTPASATLVFSYRDQVARLVELLDEGEPQAYDLCPVHADRTRPPMGWELSDTRPPRSDSPRRLDDDETVAVLAAALRGETPPTRVSVLEGGGEGTPEEATTDAVAGEAIDANQAIDVGERDDEDDEDPLRAALEELQRVARPDDDVADPVAATPLHREEAAPERAVADDITLW